MQIVLLLLASGCWAAESGGSDLNSEYNYYDTGSGYGNGIFTSSVSRLTDMTRQMHISEEDTGVRDSYEAFLSADPSSLRRALYHSSNGLSSLDDPYALALIATVSRRAGSSSSSSDDNTSILHGAGEEDLDFLTGAVPSDGQFDAMPHMTWSGFLWSWVPGTSSWSQAAPPTSFTNYRPVRIEQVIGTAPKHDQVRRAVTLVSNVYEKADYEVALESCGREKHGLLSGLLEVIGELAASLESCLEHILVVGDRVRRHDHLTHTLQHPVALIALLSRLNSDIGQTVEQQKLAFESIQMPLLEIQGDTERQKKIARHIYDVWEMTTGLQTAFEFILEYLTRQIRLMDALLQHLADRLVDSVQAAPCVRQLQLDSLEAAVMAVPTPTTRQRIIAIVKTKLSEGQLASLYDNLPANDGAFLKKAILEKSAEILGVTFSRLQRMVERKGSLNRALTYIDFHLTTTTSSSDGDFSS